MSGADIKPGYTGLLEYRTENQTFTIRNAIAVFELILEEWGEKAKGYQIGDVWYGGQPATPANAFTIEPDGKPHYERIFCASLVKTDYLSAEVGEYTLGEPGWESLAQRGSLLKAVPADGVSKPGFIRAVQIFPTDDHKAAVQKPNFTVRRFEYDQNVRAWKRVANGERDAPLEWVEEAGTGHLVARRGNYTATIEMPWLDGKYRLHVTEKYKTLVMTTERGPEAVRKLKELAQIAITGRKDNQFDSESEPPTSLQWEVEGKVSTAKWANYIATITFSQNTKFYHYSLHIQRDGVTMLAVHEPTLSEAEQYAERFFNRTQNQHERKNL